jgi:hypothetical protein
MLLPHGGDLLVASQPCRRIKPGHCGKLRLLRLNGDDPQGSLTNHQIARRNHLYRNWEKPKKCDDTLHSSDGGEESVWRFLLIHSHRLWKSRAGKKLSLMV